MKRTLKNFMGILMNCCNPYWWIFHIDKKQWGEQLDNRNGERNGKEDEDNSWGWQGMMVVTVDDRDHKRGHWRQQCHENYMGGLDDDKEWWRRLWGLMTTTRDNVINPKNQGRSQTEKIMGLDDHDKGQCDQPKKSKEITDGEDDIED